MATRAASRLEEQMAALLEKMDRQSEQLEDLAKRQTERVDGLAQKQKETEEHVFAMESDLNSVKATVDGRLTEVEGSLTGLRTELHEELLERQERLRKELRHELLRDLDATTKLLEGGLSPTAPPFVPRDVVEDGTTAPGGRGPATTGVAQQRPAPFDGKCAWDTYGAQFELLADLNKWSDTDKATHLAISLRGAAATVLTNLHPTQRRSYEALTSALDSRFGMTHQTELNRSRLKTRSRRREETLAELAEDVERLARLAYPEADESMIEVLAKDQFVDALPDEDTRLRIRQNKPATVRDALRLALELESYQIASRQRTKLVRGTHLEEGPTQLEQSTVASSADVLQQLVEAIRQCGKESQRRRSYRRDRAQQPSVSGIICWKCKERGHRRRDCPQLQNEQHTATRSENGN